LISVFPGLKKEKKMPDSTHFGIGTTKKKLE